MNTEIISAIKFIKAIALNCGFKSVTPDLIKDLELYNEAVISLIKCDRVVTRIAIDTLLVELQNASNK